MSFVVAGPCPGGWLLLVINERFLGTVLQQKCGYRVFYTNCLNVLFSEGRDDKGIEFPNVLGLIALSAVLVTLYQLL